MNESIVHTDHLTKFYGKHLALSELSLDVRQGEVFAFLGPNGAGKTTTIRILLDFIRPTQGGAKVFGLDSHTHSREIRRRIGYLPGNLEMYEGLTGRELLAYLANLQGGIDWQSVLDLSARLAIDLDRKIKTLSQGNKQKVGLAQALMGQPELLILDEPTAGLDPLVRQEFYQMVREATARGQTVFLSSHILAEVERIADRVAMIRSGRLVLVDEVTALKAKAPRRLELTFAHTAPQDGFRDLPGVLNLKIEDNILHCTVEGSVDRFLKAASKFEVTNIISHEPDLEEIFLDYYREVSPEESPNGIPEGATEGATSAS
ncbi:MAG: ABC transporter ATP-binding protein [SAR202 cluster bacterium]|nr:ABC transporter ATP-binding protein [SAR202 cluster bacterium]